jgi:type II secretory pathway pseudopilin PulG
MRGLAAAAVASIALIVAGPAYASTAPFGFNDNSVGQEQVTPEKSALLAGGAGATLSRVAFSWRDAELSPGVVDLSFYDAIYAADLAQGIRPIFTLLYAPRWALPNGVSCSAGQSCRYPPAAEHDDAWRAIVATIAARYPQLAAIEIWNEPNVAQYWNGTIDPVRYTDLVKQAYASAHAVNPALPVIAGSLANLNTDIPAGKAARPFLKSMYQAGVKGSMDGISMHSYPHEMDPWITYRMLGDVRDVRDNAGDFSTKLWITETGASSNEYPAFDYYSQAPAVVHLVSRLRVMPDAASVLVHTLINDTRAPGNDPGRGYGMVGPEPELVPKPAYCAVAEMNHTDYTCLNTVIPASDTQVQRWRAQDLLQTAAEAAREYRVRNGTYLGVTRSDLHAVSPEISEAAPDQQAQPGPAADPSRIFISTWKAADGQQFLLVCNASQSNLSYCIKTSPAGGWTYGNWQGSINAARSATMDGRTWDW